MLIVLRLDWEYEDGRPFEENEAVITFGVDPEKGIVEALWGYDPYTGDRWEVLEEDIDDDIRAIVLDMARQRMEEGHA